MSGAVDGPAVRSRKHRWLERILAFGGLAYWLLSAYLGLAFAAALLTTLTLSSVIRLYAELGVVVAAFGALIAHRWWPSAARFAHWAALRGVRPPWRARRVRRRRRGAGSADDPRPH